MSFRIQSPVTPQSQEVPASVDHSAPNSSTLTPVGHLTTGGEVSITPKNAEQTSLRGQISTLFRQAINTLSNRASQQVENLKNQVAVLNQKIGAGAAKFSEDLSNSLDSLKNSVKSTITEIKIRQYSNNNFNSKIDIILKDGKLREAWDKFSKQEFSSENTMLYEQLQAAELACVSQSGEDLKNTLIVLYQKVYRDHLNSASEQEVNVGSNDKKFLKGFEDLLNKKEIGLADVKALNGLLNGTLQTNLNDTHSRFVLSKAYIDIKNERSMSYQLGKAKESLKEGVGKANQTLKQGGQVVGQKMKASLASVYAKTGEAVAFLGKVSASAANCISSIKTAVAGMKLSNKVNSKPSTQRRMAIAMAFKNSMRSGGVSLKTMREGLTKPDSDVGAILGQLREFNQGMMKSLGRNLDKLPIAQKTAIQCDIHESNKILSRADGIQTAATERNLDDNGVPRKFGSSYCYLHPKSEATKKFNIALTGEMNSPEISDFISELKKSEKLYIEGGSSKMVSTPSHEQVNALKAHYESVRDKFIGERGSSLLNLSGSSYDKAMNTIGDMLKKLDEDPSKVDGKMIIDINLTLASCIDIETNELFFTSPMKKEFTQNEFFNDTDANKHGPAF